MNTSHDKPLQCFWNATVGTCHKSDWSSCGYDWLAKVPVGLVWLVWFFAGTYALSQFGTLKFDTTIHDPLGQGIAIALSQRKSTSVRRPWLLRYIKLCAIWAEWPTFTFTPLTIAFKISNEEGLLRGLNLNVDAALEVFGVVLVACCGLGIVILRNWKRNASGDAILKKALYPITFDLFFIPTTTLLARIGTCPEGFAHIALASGATCECVDQFGGFWCIGSGRIPNNIRVVSFSSSVYSSVCVFLFCVTGTSISSLYYSLVPLPVVWLVAWTINDRRAKLFYIPYRPIIDLLVMPEARPQLAGVIAALYADPMKIRSEDYLLIVTRLYSIARSSDAEPQSRTHALRTLWFLHCKAKGQFGEPEDEMQALPPKLWLKDRENPDRVQWTKAGMAKSELLSSKQTQVKIARIDHLSDVLQDDLATSVDLSHLALLSKVSGHSGRLSRTAGATALPELTTTAAETPPNVAAAAVADVAAAATTDNGTPDAPAASIRPPKLRSFAMPISARSSSVVATTVFGVIRIREKQWLSRNEDPVDAVQHCDELFRLAKDVMVTCTVVADKSAMFEAAMYLLQLYQARYLRLHKATYVRIVSSLCATDHTKIAIDAVHTLYKLVLDAVLPPELWLRTSSSLDLLLCALDHPSTVTVAKCVIVAKAILMAAESESRTNLFALLTPASIARLRCAFLDYHANYQISTTLEDICAGLHRMELQRGAKHREDLQRRAAASSLMRNIAQSIKSGAKSTVSVGIDRSMPSRRLSLRVSPVDPLVTANLQQMPDRVFGSTMCVQVQEIDEESTRDLINKVVSVPTTSAPTRKKLPASFGEIMELYAVPGCALEGMLASVVQPHMRQFFESQVMPFMIIR
ncbi:hypothetical protein DYB37_000474 [Aphanomyces astaci]|uniref:Uncharacterized protein n=1 Tax=Aphanomyces astaci TaxID=112090 RepID=A0A418FIP1_APHAT|nr:hypothetical protein DYB35_000357 [Aphanomyces astaci]RHZ30028.1 hypothetical protein DYB37_000474 [Aphanomyces astaci]